MEPNGNRADARLTRLETEFRNIAEDIRDIKRMLQGQDFGALKSKVETHGKILWGVVSGLGLSLLAILGKAIFGIGG